MCGIHAPSGSEFLLTEFLLDYIEEHKNSWSKQPIIHQGGEFHDAIVLVFGKPTTAIFAHLDSIGFTVKSYVSYADGTTKSIFCLDILDSFTTSNLFMNVLLLQMYCHVIV